MKIKSTTQEFVQFLNEYRIIPLAIAFVMGTASDALIKSTVNNLIMPLIQPLFASGSWQDFVWQIGPFSFALGILFADALRFVVLALVVFFVVKRVLKVEEIRKK